jgi:hypothetical protein
MGTGVTPVIERAERRFEMWSYSVGMARLLMRSTKALKLPTSLDGLLVSDADPESGARISSETGFLPDDGTRIFTVRSGAFDGYIVAGVCVVAEDDGEYFEPSQLWQEP